MSTGYTRRRTRRGGLLHPVQGLPQNGQSVCKSSIWWGSRIRIYKRLLRFNDKTANTELESGPRLSTDASPGKRRKCQQPMKGAWYCLLSEKGKSKSHDTTPAHYDGYNEKVNNPRGRERGEMEPSHTTAANAKQCGTLESCVAAAHSWTQGYSAQTRNRTPPGHRGQLESHVHIKTCTQTFTVALL